VVDDLEKGTGAGGIFDTEINAIPPSPLFQRL
jgi:hypothetical protein